MSFFMNTKQHKLEMSRVITLVKAHANLSKLIHSLQNRCFFERKFILRTIGETSFLKPNWNNIDASESDDYSFWENVRTKMIGKWLILFQSFGRVYQSLQQNTSTDMCLAYIIILGAFIAPTSILRYDPPSAVDIKWSNQIESFHRTIFGYRILSVRSSKFRNFARLTEHAQRTRSINTQLWLYK